MISLLILVPVLSMLSSLWLYRHNGRREVLRFDFVQFVYAFVLMPVLFIWLNVFVFYLLRRDIGQHVSVGEVFTINTALSTIFLFIYAFMVIHSLTKSFELRRRVDPVYDLFQHAEYFHLGVTHLATAVGSTLILTLLSLLNVFFPFITGNILSPYLLVLGGLVLGLVGIFSLLFYESPHPGFLKIVLLWCGAMFLLHVFAYFLYQPRFQMSHAFYWVTFFGFTTFIPGSVLLSRSKKMRRILEKLKHRRVQPKLEKL